MTKPLTIAGYGMLSPLGQGPAESVEAMVALRSGLKPCEFEGYESIVAGFVPNHPEEDEDNHVQYSRIVAADAMAMAGSNMPEDSAVIFTSSKGRIQALLNPPDPTSICKFPGDTVSEYLSKHFQFSGPQLNYPAACASGLIAVIKACELIEAGICKSALAGVTEAFMHPLLMAGFVNMGAISSSPMKPFQADRAGFNPGEGAAAFVITASDPDVKSYCDIVAWDYRCDAAHITAGDKDGSTLAYSIRKTLDRAGWNTTDVDYICLHGTGTRINDETESLAIHKIFGPDHPPVSSLKPYIGHLLGANGAVELALIVAALQEGFIPPTVNMTDPDPALKLNHVKPGGEKRQIRRFLKFSVGFGGHIAVAAFQMPQTI